MIILNGHLFHGFLVIKIICILVKKFYGYLEPLPTH